MKKPSTGFTIIELMIATTILSVILVLVSAMAIKIGSLYTKGVNQSKIQDNVRTAMDEITQHLQLMGGSTAYQQAPTPTNAGALCIDSTRYTYVLDKQIGTDSAHVLWRDTMTSPATSNTTCTPATLTNNDPSSGTGGTNGQELASPNSRLTAFCIGDYVNNTCSVPSTTTSPFSITIGMAYGGTDLTSNKGISTTCDKNIGDHYCATAYLSTIVDQRVGSVGVGTGPGPGPGGSGDCTLPASHPVGSPGGVTNTYQMDYAVNAQSVAPYPFYTTTDQRSPENPSGYHGPQTYSSFTDGSYNVIAATVIICVDDSSRSKDFTNTPCDANAAIYPDGAFSTSSNQPIQNQIHSPGNVNYPGVLQAVPGVSGAYTCSNGLNDFGPGTIPQPGKYVFDVSSFATSSNIYDIGIYTAHAHAGPYCPSTNCPTLPFFSDYPPDYYINYVRYNIGP